MTRVYLVNFTKFIFKIRWIPFSGFGEECENVSDNQRPGRPSYFSDQPKNKNIVEDVEIFIPVKFRWIPFRSFRWEIENVSANQKPGGHLDFPIGPKKHKLGRGRSDLAVKIRWIPFSRFRGKSKMSQSIRGQEGHLVFPIGLKKTLTS